MSGVAFWPGVEDLTEGIAVQGTLTTEETAGNGSDDDLKGKQAAHSSENSPALLVDGVNPDDMDRRAHGQEDGRADGLKEVEMRAGLLVSRQLLLSLYTDKALTA